jgi:hypothetical protein
MHSLDGLHIVREIIYLWNYKDAQHSARRVSDIYARVLLAYNRPKTESSPA